jgi:hypothetical protein
MTSNIQSLKSAQADSRVRLDKTNQLYSERFNLGPAIMGPAGIGDQYILVDGRPANKFSSFQFLGGCPECSHSNISASEMIAYESNQRPSMPVSASGIRHYDTLGVGRDMFARDLYAERSNRGQWNKMYMGQMNKQQEFAGPSFATAPAQPAYNLSHSAVSELYHG